MPKLFEHFSHDWPEPASEARMLHRLLRATLRGLPLARFLTAQLLIGVFLGCEPPQTRPLGTGRIALSVSAVSSLSPVDSWRVSINGPSGSQARTGAPGTTIEFLDLRPGQYDVTLEGLQGRIVIQRGETSVGVQAGAMASATVSVTPVPGTLAVVNGDQQLGWDGQPLHLPVVVRLADPAGGPVPGVNVTVTPTVGGGGLVGSTALVTDANGRVSIPYRLGNAPGVQGYRVQAQVGGTTLTANVALVSGALTHWSVGPDAGGRTGVGSWGTTRWAHL